MTDTFALQERGMAPETLLPEVEQITRAQLADFLQGFDLVWYW